MGVVEEALLVILIFLGVFVVAKLFANHKKIFKSTVISFKKKRKMDWISNDKNH